ncbi:MAG: HIT family protein [Thermoanaerobaculia bacterium]
MSEKPRACIFCEALREEPGPGNLVVDRKDRVFTMLNRYPYANGHLLVAPVAHQARLSESDSETLAELIDEVALSQKILDGLYHPSGFNVGANFGRAGGAGIESHYHFHVVPRWEGDVNFMTVTAATRVIPEELGTTWENVSGAFEKAQVSAAR